MHFQAHGIRSGNAYCLDSILEFGVAILYVQGGKL